MTARDLPNSYAAADAVLGTRNSRKVAYATRLHRAHGGIAIEHHSTDIVTFRADGWTILDQSGWRSVTTSTRVHAATPPGWYIGRNGRHGWYLWRTFAPILPFADGIAVNADGRVGFTASRGEPDTLLTADDVAAIVDAAAIAATERETKRVARLNAAHPAARTFNPNASGLFAQYSYGPGTPHRARDVSGCVACARERETWTELRADALARSHDGLSLPLDGGGHATYPPHSTLRYSYQRGATIYDCPRCRAESEAAQ